MFQKLLIANRGEVAVRVARTARRLGIATVGVHSQADAGAAWLENFDERVNLGGSTPRESYLRADSIVQAALQTGATALHPGWGFLSENPRFAALVEQHGIRFVGPSARIMRTMGLKSPAKEAMRAAGLPVIPGSVGLLEDMEQTGRCAEEVGYPVILKADAGGGGRGMRLVRDPSELESAWASATNEATAAFGNGKLYLEKYLSGGRHIEVQVLGDAFGNALHLYERECSVQRKHQKLIEETPSPVLAPSQREQLGMMSARAVAALRYANAGTIEFLRSASGQIYFMEMNTRLQVEHPVTEMTTGLDLVEQQLRVAANQPLALRQEEIHPRGHAIECRINAEDPAQDFKPSPGVLEAFEFPDAIPGATVRIETHMRSGDEISPYYDSLIAKVVVHAPNRMAAIQGMEQVLRGAVVRGVSTTIPVHLAVLASREFRAGEYDTASLPGWSVR
jgi:acetyl-CoA carboxylase biotin carboxylase subunit